ncbi:GntR family transcriptional regulator [Bacillota bacterium Meth-B3]|nr:GntR family transcriptional regulator [Christensenellaceae bacterium]
MDIVIRNAGGQPIYEQIMAQIKGQIASGRLAPGEMLPSIRALAKDLRISVITTKRAYDELTREGYIETAPGRGSYVAERDAELMREEHLRQIEEHLCEAWRLAAACGLSKSDLGRMLEVLDEEGLV